MLVEECEQNFRIRVSLALVSVVAFAESALELLLFAPQIRLTWAVSRPEGHWDRCLRCHRRHWFGDSVEMR